MKNSKTMDVDGFVDLDNVKTISHDTARLSRFEIDSHSTLPVKNSETTNDNHLQRNLNSLFTSNDSLNIIDLSSQNNSFHDKFMSSVQTDKRNVFTDNSFELVKTCNDTNDHLFTQEYNDKSSQHRSPFICNDHLLIKDEDIYKSPSINNLVHIVHHINQKRLPFSHLPSAYNDTIASTEIGSTTNDKQFIEWSAKVATDDQKQSITNDSLHPVVYESFSAPSRELNHKPLGKINDMTIAIHDLEVFVESEQNLNVLQSGLPSATYLSRIFNDSFFKNFNDDRQLSLKLENNFNQVAGHIEEDIEKLYQHYLIHLERYQMIKPEISAFQQNQHILTPISEEPIPLAEHVAENKTKKSDEIERFYSTLTVKRQSNRVGHYGFELEQAFDGKIKISSILDSNYCPDLNKGDEIISINSSSILTTSEQCHLLFYSLWYDQNEYIRMTVCKPTNFPNISRK